MKLLIIFSPQSVATAEVAQYHTFPAVGIHFNQYRYSGRKIPSVTSIEFNTKEFWFILYNQTYAHERTACV